MRTITHNEIQNKRKAANNTSVNGKVQWFYASKSVYKSWGLLLHRRCEKALCGSTGSFVKSDCETAWSDVTWVIVGWGWRWQVWKWKKSVGRVWSQKEMSLSDLCSPPFISSYWLGATLPTASITHWNCWPHCWNCCCFWALWII